MPNPFLLSITRDDFLSFRVVGEERGRAVAVGEKINGLADPHRIAIIRILARHLDHARISKLGDPDRCRLPAAVSLPVRFPLKNWERRRSAIPSGE